MHFRIIFVLATCFIFIVDSSNYTIKHEKSTSKIISPHNYTNLEDCVEKCPKRLCHFCKRTRDGQFRCHCLEKLYKKITTTVNENCTSNTDCEKCAYHMETGKTECLQPIAKWEEEELPMLYRDADNCRATCNGYCHLCSNRTIGFSCFCWDKYHQPDPSLVRKRSPSGSYPYCVRPCDKCVDCAKDSFSEKFHCSCMVKDDNLMEYVKEEKRRQFSSVEECNKKCASCQFCDSNASCFCWNETYVEIQAPNHVGYYSTVCNGAACDKCINCEIVDGSQPQKFSCKCLVKRAVSVTQSVKVSVHAETNVLSPSPENNRRMCFSAANRLSPLLFFPLFISVKLCVVIFVRFNCY